ncbi:class I mannose-6-phosphate isomerase [Virgibacillus chiguensis]|uniref:Mannose-6-phosphate isomerase, class I n=1 Tax=Virgibacillus chiguensis TaxID=411959 RepID=A0A1M5T1S2_9BACI|nr:class I mannose-6-phosphate isomerase [Virgibacillus chiguensis]SHH44721.1 Mannose-6-phosphate isomerase, class I [Virgibacillus chiguensis]
MAYDLYPQIDMKGGIDLYTGYDEIWKKVDDAIKQRKANVITIECYPGTLEKELEQLINQLKPDLIIHADEIFLSSEEITVKIQDHLTDDRVFGVMSNHALADFIDGEKFNKTLDKINKAKDKRIVIYGVGASLVAPSDLLLYTNLARWEIQLRYRAKKVCNWRANNWEEETLRKVKRAYYFDWRIADKLKKSLFDKVDFMLDVNEENQPKMIAGHDYQMALSQVVQRPFRLVPYFDSGVWGGKWMQEKFNVAKDKINLAWCFDCVPEENSIYLGINGEKFEIPANDIVYQRPVSLLGEKVYGRYGTSFPIRFDYLDTMGGDNLSLQVHPKVEYAQETFGLHYTQDESYYILEAEDDAVIYLGVKNGVEKQSLVDALKSSQEEGKRFPDEDFIYRKKIKKHDHYSIPAGTIHCSGKNSVVLEISSTPNRFTFKLWDWERVDLDGKPRPIHLEHGEKNIDISRDEDWVEKEVSNQVVKVAEGDGWTEEKTGLHIREPIETRRHWFSSEVMHETQDSVNVLTLVEGEEIIVTSVNASFEPFVIHYGETFIVPECVKQYKIAPHGPSVGRTVGTIKAFIR